MDKTPQISASLLPATFDIDEWFQQDYTPDTSLPVVDISVTGLTASDELLSNDDLPRASISSSLTLVALELGNNQFYPKNTATVQVQPPIIPDAQSLQLPSLSAIFSYFDEVIPAQTETAADLSLFNSFDNSLIGSPTGNLSLEEQHLIDEARPFTEEDFPKPLPNKAPLSTCHRRTAKTSFVQKKTATDKASIENDQEETPGATIQISGTPHLLSILDETETTSPSVKKPYEEPKNKAENQPSLISSTKTPILNQAIGIHASMLTVTNRDTLRLEDIGLSAAIYPHESL